MDLKGVLNFSEFYMFLDTIVFAYLFSLIDVFRFFELGFSVYFGSLNYFYINLTIHSSKTLAID